MDKGNNSYRALINAVKSFPCLYDDSSSNSSFLQKEKKDDAWRRVTESLLQNKIHIIDPIQRWRLLRQNFTRHHKSGNIKWIYYNDMRFLIDYVKHKPQANNNTIQSRQLPVTFGREFSLSNNKTASTPQAPITISRPVSSMNNNENAVFYRLGAESFLASTSHGNRTIPAAKTNETFSCCRPARESTLSTNSVSQGHSTIPQINNNDTSVFYRLGAESFLPTASTSHVNTTNPAIRGNNSFPDHEFNEVSLFNNKVEMDYENEMEATDYEDIENFIVGDNLDHCYFMETVTNVQEVCSSTSTKNHAPNSRKEGNQIKDIAVDSHNEGILSQVGNNLQKTKQKEIKKTISKKIKVPKMDNFALKKIAKRKQAAKEVETEIISSCKDFRNLTKSAKELISLQKKEVKNRISQPQILQTNHIECDEGLLNLIRKEFLTLTEQEQEELFPDILLVLEEFQERK